MLEALAAAIARATDEWGTHETAVAGLTLLRADGERSPNLVLYNPALCAVVQGRKWTDFGERRVDCGPGEAILVGVQTLGVGRVVEASPERPYLGFVIELDLSTLRAVLEETGLPPASTGEPRGIFPIDLDGPLADGALRLVRLLETPAAVPILRPLIMRELAYWLLTGPHGDELQRIALASAPTRAVVDTLHLLRERFAEPIRVEELARAANLSPSAFHERFKALTATTPLQYQKALRLHEARRLMVATEASVETVAAQVGYESASQFSREYARTFGAPPRKDAARFLSQRD